MNLGARASTGDILLFLHADTSLHPEAFGHLRQTMANQDVAGGTFTLQFDTPGFLLRSYAFFTRFRFHYFHYGDQGIFVRRSIFERLNGFKAVPLMEDADFLKRLEKEGWRALIHCPVTTSARRFRQKGIARQQLCNMLLVLGYAIGISPVVLSKWYPVFGNGHKGSGDVQGIEKVKM